MTEDEKRYCTYCDSELEMLNVEGIQRSCCAKCRKIEYGYTKEWKPVVLALREDLSDNEAYKINGLMGIIREYCVLQAEQEVADETKSG